MHVIIAALTPVAEIMSSPTLVANVKFLEI